MTSHSIFRRIVFIPLLTVLFCISSLSLKAQLIPIGPFGGAVAETFEGFPVGFTNSPVPIMGGAATIQTGANGVGIDRPLSMNFSLGSSSENAPGVCALPADGQNFFGIEHDFNPTATMDLVFTNTVKAFGGYWGAGTADSNSPAIIVFTFFDAADQQIGSPQSVSYLRVNGDGTLEWHGWFSRVPFKHVRVTAANIFTLVGDSFHAGAGGFSVFTSITPLSPSKFVLAAYGTTGVVYNLQVSTNLATTNWTTVTPVQTDTNGFIVLTNLNAVPLRQQFFRLKAP